VFARIRHCPYTLVVMPSFISAFVAKDVAANALIRPKDESA